MLRTLLPLLFWLVVLPLVGRQAQPALDAAEIRLAMDKLQTLGSVLYVAAHPDDENTHMLTFLARDRHVQTTYLSLTRGDGGQNLIGKELRDELGIIRTQELLAARRKDGAKQWFSRANDFGFSKNPRETFQIWDSVQVLEDVVWAIRLFRPDVIITRFSPDPADTHGHHTASAQLARTAFGLAGDPQYFPDQLQYVQVWQPRRIFWNTSAFFYNTPTFDKTGLAIMDVGGYNPLLGASYGEIAAASRSMHKSQGFGSAASRGSRLEYLKPLDGGPAVKDVFEGMDFSWNRVPGGQKIGKMIAKLAKKYDPEHPEASVPALLELRAQLIRMGGHRQDWPARKIAEVEELIQACAGLYVEATATQYAVARGDSLRFTTRLIVRNPLDVRLVSASFPLKEAPQALEINKLYEFVVSTYITDDQKDTHPYWLRKAQTKGMFVVDDRLLVGLPENPAPVHAWIRLHVGDTTTLALRVPVAYKWVAPEEGELYRPLEITPRVTANMDREVYIFDGQAKTLRVTLENHSRKSTGQVRVVLPKGWTSTPEVQDFVFQDKGQTKEVIFQVQAPTGAATTSEIRAIVTTQAEGRSYTDSASVLRIAYDHIPRQTIFPPAVAKALFLPLARRSKRIGYIEGAGDEVPACLEQMGYEVEWLKDEQLRPTELARYEAVVLGIGAYVTRPALKFAHDSLMRYVEQGGNVIVQYNNSRGLVRDSPGPFALRLSRDRVTVEEAPMTILLPEHPVLKGPNPISPQDFEGWVQERGLYFADQWDSRYEAPLECHDPGESPKKGGLLIARHGKGYFAYTGFSFFRHLPEGVPGAYRLFANLIEMGK